MVDTPAMESRKSHGSSEPESRRVDRLAARLASLRPRYVALFAGIGITVFVILGILQRTAYPSWSAANLDSEASIATIFAAALLWAAAICWMLIAAIELPRHWPTVGWSVLLVLIALDEANAFHEALERRLEVDWQILYLPILAFGAYVCWRVLQRYWPSTTATLLVAAAGMWAVTLFLELVQNWGGPPVRAAIYDPTMITEEGLEMVGSTLILLAGLSALRTLHGINRRSP